MGDAGSWCVVLLRGCPIVVPLRRWAALQPAFSPDHLHHAVCHSDLPAFCAALGVGARHGWRGSALRRPSRVPQDVQVEVARSRLRADVRPARCSPSLPNPLAAPSAAGPPRRPQQAQPSRRTQPGLPEGPGRAHPTTAAAGAAPQQLPLPSSRPPNPTSMTPAFLLIAHFQHPI